MGSASHNSAATTPAQKIPATQLSAMFLPPTRAMPTRYDAHRGSPGLARRIDTNACSAFSRQRAVWCRRRQSSHRPDAGTTTSATAITFHQKRS